METVNIRVSKLNKRKLIVNLLPLPAVCDRFKGEIYT